MAAVVSVPALAAALRRCEQGNPIPPAGATLDAQQLVPMYRLAPGTVEDEAHAAAQLVNEVGERMRRLAGAYGEWRLFEAGPYFDLSPAQVAEARALAVDALVAVRDGRTAPAPPPA